MVRWFDSWAAAESAGEVVVPRRVDWVRVIPFLFMHVACVAVIWVGWSPVAVLTAAALYVVRMFAITGFYHRYFSHRTYQTSRAAQFVFAVIGASSVQRGPLWWAAHHRVHHKTSDHEGDAHSPRLFGFVWSHVGWITARENFRTKIEQVPDLAKFPELCFLDRFDTLVPVLFAAACLGAGSALHAVAPDLGTDGPQMLVWAFFISTVALFHGTFTINSLSHMFGSRAYVTDDDSRNNWALALLTLGEGWHNNHHYYQAAVRQGFRWWQIDVTYYGLRALALLGIVWDLHPVPERVLAAADPVAAERSLAPPTRS
ncbi:MAG: acyl-CoA desaturase [Planctomycetes bacterium]|nr:acyl-CoA desaturase [Planctomycetota bacterium]